MALERYSMQLEDFNSHALRSESSDIRIKCVEQDLIELRDLLNVVLSSHSNAGEFRAPSIGTIFVIQEKVGENEQPEASIADLSLIEEAGGDDTNSE
jgi:hypothetical protein